MQLLDKISFSLERMQALIVDLDDISRLETGNIRLNLGTLDLRELIGKIVESFEHDLMVENHELNIRMPDDLPPIWADRGRMIQVLTNLLRNALKYTPDGGEISLTAVHNRQHHTIDMTIQDTGLGIHPDEQKKIFSKYFRSEESDIQARPGTGLGLYITKALIEMQNGRIWFESKYGEGTAFYVTMPIANEEAEAARERDTAVSLS